MIGRLMWVSVIMYSEGSGVSYCMHFGTGWFALLDEREMGYEAWTGRGVFVLKGGLIMNHDYDYSY